MSSEQQYRDRRYYEATDRLSLANRMMIVARSRIYADFISLCQPRPEDKILDVGVSDVINDGANLIERHYPLSHNITAVGLGEGGSFREAFPQIVYRQIEAGAALPFDDQSFDIAVSNAVLEHVGSVDRQRQFIAEIRRVSRVVLITVPNRMFPVEHHTALPILHWWDSTFRWGCRLTDQVDWSRSESLILMTRRRLLELCPAEVHLAHGTTGIPLGPFSSNLYLLVRGGR